MTVPLVFAATAASVGAPAHAAGSKHQQQARSGVRWASERILSRGDTGPDVVRLQRLLGIPADGIFGPQTDRAVRSFQRAHHLLVDGEVGPKTRAALARNTGGDHATRGDGILRLHDRGTAVQRLQRRLGIPADGIFGPQTLRAVKRFQAVHHLLVDGQVGPKTRGALARNGNGSRSNTAGRSTIILRLWDRGPAVARLQRALGIRADGDFGRITLSAVKRFQSRHGLLVDGEAGPRTLGALGLELHGGVTHHAFGGGSNGSGTGAGNGGGSTATSGSTLGARAAALARNYLGVRYAWGGESPAGFDCSGLVQYVYGRLGVGLPRVTWQQWNAGRHVPRSALRAGDLVFFHGRGHVGIYLGGGRFIHAPNSGEVVQIDSLWGWYSTAYDGAVRVG